MAKKSQWTGTKKDFILSFESSALPNEIVAAGKEQGVALSIDHVYAVRSLAKRLAKKPPGHAHKKGNGKVPKHPRRRASLAKRALKAAERTFRREDDQTRLAEVAGRLIGDLIGTGYTSVEIDLRTRTYKAKREEVEEGRAE